MPLTAIVSVLRLTTLLPLWAALFVAVLTVATMSLLVAVVVYL